LREDVRETKNVPLVVVEEHHEAFYVWHYAAQEGWLGRDGNTLLHVDEHADMFLPRLRRPLTSISSLTDLAEFTYNELNIGNFIWPAIYLGFFSRVLWLRYKHEISAGGWRTIYTCGKDTDKREFVAASSLASSPYADAEDIRSVEYAPVTTAEFLNTNLPVSSRLQPGLLKSSIETSTTFYESLQESKSQRKRAKAGTFSFMKTVPDLQIRSPRRVVLQRESMISLAICVYIQ
jgi:hypothetical protein